MIAEFRQQAVVIELIHYEFCILQYGTTDRYRFAHQYFCFGTFRHCEGVVDDLRTLVVGFCDGSDELFFVGNQTNVTSPTNVFARFTVETVHQ